MASTNLPADTKTEGSSLTLSSSQTFGPGFPGKVWYMIFCHCARELGFPQPHDLPARRSDGDGNVWQVARDRGDIRVLKHVNRVRIEAAEVEVGSIKSSLPQMLSMKRAYERELQRRRNENAPAAEIEDTRLEYEHSLQAVRQALKRHDECADLIATSKTDVFIFPVESVEKLIFGDVPITMKSGPGPKMDVQPIRFEKEEDGLEEWCEEPA